MRAAQRTQANTLSEAVETAVTRGRMDTVGRPSMPLSAGAFTPFALSFKLKKD